MCHFLCRYVSHYQRVHYCCHIGPSWYHPAIRSATVTPPRCSATPQCVGALAAAGRSGAAVPRPERRPYGTHPVRAISALGAREKWGCLWVLYGFIMRFEDKCGFWGGREGEGERERERESETLPKTHGFTLFYIVLHCFTLFYMVLHGLADSVSWFYFQWYTCI